LFRGALHATIDLHLNQRAAEIPAIKMLRATEDELRNRAVAMKDRLSDLPFQIAIGPQQRQSRRGGTLPKSMMSSVAIEILPKNCSPCGIRARYCAAQRHRSSVISPMSV